MMDTTRMKSFAHDFIGDSCSESSGYPEDVKIDKEDDNKEKHDEQSYPEAFDVDNNIPMCAVCGVTPCQWVKFGYNLFEQGNEIIEQTASVSDDGSSVIVLGQTKALVKLSTMLWQDTSFILCSPTSNKATWGEEIVLVSLNV